MRMTPLEIQSHRFGRQLGGYDREEVETLLRMLSEDYESLLRENESQRDHIHDLETRLEALSRQERLLQETLLQAQSMREEMRKATERECASLIGEAEVRAEKLLDASHRRAAQITQNIRDMRSLRSGLAAALRSAIETHLGLIESLEKNTADDTADKGVVDAMVEGKITYLAASQPVLARRTREDPEWGGERSGGALHAESTQSSGSA